MISIIVPVYKVEEYLSQCVESILAQTFSDYELWLVDDGSPDRCPAICDAYAAKDARIRVIHKENGGLSSARNAALDQMTGDYICFVDSDDYLSPDALETLYAALAETQAEMAVGNMFSVDETGTVKPFYVPAAERTVLTGNALFSTMKQPCAPNRLYKAALFQNLRFPEGRLYEDVFIYHKLLAQTGRIVLTGKTDYYYRQRSGSIMRATYDPRFTDIVFAVKERYEWLDSIDQPRLANEARLFVYSRVAVAYAHLDPSDAKQKALRREITEIFKDCYQVLMNDTAISRKQKCRLWLLRYLPAVHTWLFGRRMPIVLG